MADDAPANNQPRMSVRETLLSAGRTRLEAFYNIENVTVATLDLDCMSEEVGIELVRGLFNAMRQRRSGVILPVPGTKVS